MATREDVVMATLIVMFDNRLAHGDFGVAVIYALAFVGVVITRRVQQ